MVCYSGLEEGGSSSRPRPLRPQLSSKEIAMTKEHLTALQHAVKLAKEEWASFVATGEAPRHYIMVQGQKAASLLRFHKQPLV